MLAIYTNHPGKNLYTLEPRYNEGSTDWQNMFAITRFRYIEVLFHIFYYYWGKGNPVFFILTTLLHRGSTYRGSTVQTLKLYNLQAWWKNYPPQSISKLTEQIGKSRKIARSQITAHIFWNLSKRNGLSSAHIVAFLKIVSQNGPDCISAHIHFKNFPGGHAPNKLVAFSHSRLLPQTVNPSYNTVIVFNSGHIELIRFKEYYRMPRGHEHISFVFSSASRDIFS